MADSPTPLSTVSRGSSDSESQDSTEAAESLVSSNVFTTPSTAQKTTPGKTSSEEISPESSPAGSPVRKKIKRTWEVRSAIGKPSESTQSLWIRTLFLDKEEGSQGATSTQSNEEPAAETSASSNIPEQRVGSPDIPESSVSTKATDSSSSDSSKNSTESSASSDNSERGSSEGSEIDHSNSDNYLSVDSDSDSDNPHCDGNLYEGCDRTVDEAVYDILKDYFKNRETQVSLKDHLTTFLKYLPKLNNMPKTVKQLFKYVEQLDPSFKEKEYVYCGKCLITIQDKTVAKCSVCDSTSRSTFFMFSLEDQLKHLLENSGLARELDKAIEKRSNRQEDGIIRDICDGSEYKRLNVQGYDLTLMWFTDGVSVTRTSLWPIYYVICELPFHLRRQYIGVCGAWCDKSKPVMNCFLDPFATSLKDIYDKGGVTWKHPTTGLQCTSIVRAPVASADAPARADLQMIQGPNSKRACNTCEQKTLRVPLTAAEIQAKEAGARISVRRAFIYSETTPVLRTHERILKQGQKAVKKTSIVKGVKGPSVVQIIPELDLSTFVYAEYMHGVCLGVVRLLLNLWFTVPGNWNIKNHELEIDSFIAKIRPPKEINRILKGVSHFPQWKANECRQWLLFVSLIALKDFLKAEYFQHWMLFVIAIYSLLKEEISLTDIDSAERMLRLFVRDIEELYRGRDCVYNVHQLLHLGLYTRRWGPLPDTSAFLFEDFNGTLMQMIHGTRNKTKELANSLRRLHGLQILGNKYCKNDPQDLAIPEMLSSFMSSRLTPIDKAFLRNMSVNLKETCLYSRLKFKREVFTSLFYTPQKGRNNYTVCFKVQGRTAYGEVKYFLQPEEKTSLQETVAVVKQFTVEHTRIFRHAASGSTVQHIVPIKDCDEILVLVNLDNIVCKVFRVGDFVCKLPNKRETNL